MGLKHQGGVRNVQVAMNVALEEGRCHRRRHQSTS